MNCGRCSGTYKRKFKNFHDCVRHLQNQFKTMGEEVTALKEKLVAKDRVIQALENRVFFEIQDLKLEIQKLREDNHLVTSRLSSLSMSNSQLLESGTPAQSNANLGWDLESSRLFSQGAAKNEAQFQVALVQREFRPED